MACDSASSLARDSASHGDAEMGVSPGEVRVEDVGKEPGIRARSVVAVVKAKAGAVLWLSKMMKVQFMVTLHKSVI